MHRRSFPKSVLFTALIMMNVLRASIVLAQDSFRAVCSGFVRNTSNPSETMEISIDFLDQRYRGVSRKYTLSSIYQLRLWQGAVVGSGDDYKGTITLRHGSRRLFFGKFDLANGPHGYSMSLDGRLSKDPGAMPAFLAMGTLPCVNLTP
jgi:hypothetical protein